MALEFEEFEDGDALGGGELAGGVGAEEAVDVVLGAVEDDVDVGVAGGPKVFEERCGDGFGEGRGAVAEEVEGVAERSTPWEQDQEESSTTSASQAGGNFSRYSP